jgi:hypothetical protein
MNQKTVSAWDMNPDTLIHRFAEYCSRVGSASGCIDVMVGSNQAEARYLGGIILARMKGKDKELPFRPGDTILLKDRNTARSESGSGDPLYLCYEETKSRFSFFRENVIPRDKQFVVARVHYKDDKFFVEIWLNRDETGLFPATNFIAAPANEATSA